MAHVERDESGAGLGAEGRDGLVAEAPDGRRAHLRHDARERRGALAAAAREHQRAAAR